VFASETRAGQAAGTVIPQPADGPVNRKRVVAVGTVAAVLIAGAGAVAWAYIGDVPRGTTILGVDLGGRARSEAERALTEAVGPRTGDPVAVDLAGERFSIGAADIALRLDVARSVSKAIKGSPRLVGERTVQPVIELDEAELERTLRGHLDPGKVTLDVAAAATAVRQAWLVGGVATIDLVTEPPATTREQVDPEAATPEPRTRAGR